MAIGSFGIGLVLEHRLDEAKPTEHRGHDQRRGLIVVGCHLVEVSRPLRLPPTNPAGQLAEFDDGSDQTRLRVMPVVELVTELQQSLEDESEKKTVVM